MQAQWIPKQQVNQQQWTTQETILEEEVQQTTKEDILEEQTHKEQSTGEDSGRGTNLLLCCGWTKALVV